MIIVIIHIYPDISLKNPNVNLIVVLKKKQSNTFIIV